MDGGIMAENYNGMAVGIFELDSFAACFVALDAASKAAKDVYKRQDEAGSVFPRLKRLAKE